MELTGALYLRVSRKEQREGISLDEQRIALTEYAERYGIHIIAIYEEDASTWKRNRHRDQFDAMVADAHAGKFNRILVWKLDRFARTQREIHNTIVELEEIDVFLILVREGTDFSKMSRHMRSVTRGGMAIGTEIETLAKSDRAIMTNDYRRRTLKIVTTGRRATGYVFGGKFQPSKIDEPRAEGVRFAFMEYATNNYSLVELVEKLNQMGYTLAGGKPYTDNALRYILHNYGYTGRILVDGQWIESNEPRIIPDELFNQVQRVLEMRSTAPRTAARKFRSHLLNGILFCSHCGSKMYVRNSKAYICRLTRTPGDRCPADGDAPKLIAESILARRVDELVSNLRLPTNWQQHIVGILNGQDTAEDIESKRTRIKHQIERTKNLYIMGDMTIPEYTARRDELNDQLAKLVEPDQPDTSYILKAGEYLENIPSVWAGADTGERRNILESLFSALWLDRIERRLCNAGVYPEFVPLFGQMFEMTDGKIFVL
jgi:site-specific DNA recombinase